MRVTARVEYATRALVDLARHASLASGVTAARKAADISTAQAIPPAFLDDILADLRRHSIVASQRGSAGGWRLALPPDEITVAGVIRAVEGPLADVRGERPDELDYPPELAALQTMWVALRANVRSVLEATTIAHLRDNALTPDVALLAAAPDAWVARPAL